LDIPEFRADYLPSDRSHLPLKSRF